MKIKNMFPNIRFLIVVASWKNINGTKQEVKPLNGSSISLTHAKSLLKSYIESTYKHFKNVTFIFSNFFYLYWYF